MLLPLPDDPLLVELPRLVVDRPDVDRELDERRLVERLPVEREALERRLVERVELERRLLVPDAACPSSFCAFSKSR